MIANNLDISVIEAQDLGVLHKLLQQRSSFFLFNELIVTCLTEIKYVYQNDKQMIYSIRNKNGRVIGFVHFQNISRNTRMFCLKIVFDEKSKKDLPIMVNSLKRICNYLFMIENVHKIVIQCLAYEKLLIEVISQVGFVLEVNARESFYNYGVYEDVLYYGLLMEENKTMEQ
jgi:RimJ/RimL family protein N-acetyltransferase